MLYSVELIGSVEVEVDALSEAEAIKKAKADVDIDLYNVSVIDVECLEEQDASDN